MKICKYHFPTRHYYEELEQIENEEISGQIFKSNIKWTEEGEWNSKFFLSLEKRNYTNKLISALEIKGK